MKIASEIGIFKVANQAHYQDKAKNLLKGELKRRGVGYKELADRLAKIGVNETERNIANKISRGGFSTVFFLQCMDVIGVKTLSLIGTEPLDE